jgi:hypothetical protein
MKGSSYLCSQITGGVENAVPVYVDIPGTGGRGSDLPFEVVVQEVYLQFLGKHFLLVHPFGGYCCKRCPSNNSRRKKSQGLGPGERAGQISLLIIVPEDTG